MSALPYIIPKRIPFPTRDLQAERDAMEAAVFERARRHQTRLEAAERAGYAAGFDAGIAKGERRGDRIGFRRGLLTGAVWAVVLIGAGVGAWKWLAPPVVVHVPASFSLTT